MGALVVLSKIWPFRPGNSYPGVATQPVQPMREMNAPQWLRFIYPVLLLRVAWQCKNARAGEKVPRRNGCSRIDKTWLAEFSSRRDTSIDWRRRSHERVSPYQQSFRLRSYGTDRRTPARRSAPGGATSSIFALLCGSLDHQRCAYRH